MQKTPYKVGPVDSLSLNADLTETFRNYRPAVATVDYQGAQPVDGLALSQEMLEGHDEDESLCGNLLAAWA